ncbi:Phosphatidylinositol 3- and 4-kinase [Popillia japonica]|uniref:Serine/threonine-protein kinase ATR n=1 Tax=Popillia japonica TaxID=7064 RepID=A0AAW1KKE4_POPJA
MIGKNRNELDQMILGYNGIDASIVNLLEILTAGCREKDNALKLACESKVYLSHNYACECIGELGAIEPSHLPRKYAETQSFAFFITDDAFIQNSLTELIRALQSEENTTIMDRFALAIQETLKTYGVGPEASTPKHKIWKQFPQTHKELMVPFLSSRYTMGQVLEPVQVSPIYGSKMGGSFQAWTHNWICHLIFTIKTDKRNLLEVCLPSMKQNHRTLMHFLPHILLHSLLEGSSDDLSKCYTEFMAVINSFERPKLPPNTEFDLAALSTSSNVPEPRAIISEEPDRSQCMKVIFVLLDFLERWLREWQWQRNAAGRDDGNYKKILFFMSKFCKLQLGKCSFRCGEYSRALMYLEDYIANNQQELENNLYFLTKIYAQLDEPDAVSGVSALRNREPTIQQRILELEVAGKLSDAVACYERIPPPLKLRHLQGLIQCYLDLDNVNTALNFTEGAVEKQPEYEGVLLEMQAEPLWRLNRYDDLDELLKKHGLKDNNSWGVNIGRALLQIGTQSKFSETLKILRSQQIDSLAATSLEEGIYQHGYESIVKLHALNELEQIETIVRELLLKSNDHKAAEWIINKLSSEWDLRIKVVQESTKIMEPILCLRRVALNQAKRLIKEQVPSAVPHIDSLLGESWLLSAKIARKAGIHQQAYTYTLKAEEYAPPKLFLERAKLHWLREEFEEALTTLNRGVEKLQGDLSEASRSDKQIMCAKAKLLIAIYNDKMSNVDTEVNTMHYKDALEMNKEWEKSYVLLGQYYDRIFQNYTSEDRDNKGSDIQIHMINYFGKSMLYGSNYVYQSMPRMLSIWFDYGTRLLEANSPTKDERKQNLLRMTKLIDNFLERLPSYIFLTAFSQIISRICHPQKEVYIELKAIIIKLLLEYPQQTMWMMISVIKSGYSIRARRCAEILGDSKLKNPAMIKLVTDFTKLAEKLIELCNKEIPENVNVTNINTLLRSLPRLLTKSDFSEIMVPTQKFRKLVLPNPDFKNAQHNPFPNHYVYIIGVEDEVAILQSLQRPRKITFRGSDGKGYIQMLKPKDDLRKDFRLMEFNDIVNQMLSKEPNSRQRRLNIRLYSVAPLNEECGLIEWIPKLVGLRNILTAIYKQKGLNMRGKELREAAYNLRDPLSRKREIFEKILLARHPPVLGEWFRRTFPDVQGWLTARTAYTRTTAVISMVGYILGLGDRHGENVLLDSISGDTVHVDFNCLFNKGETFEWPERVPFRLTHNMVSAMGPLGVEGTFRKSCACTLKVLRTHTDTLMSIVTPFVYDPLVSWPRNSTVGINAQNAERTNEQAVEHVRNIQLRLQGMIRTKGRPYSIALSVDGQINNIIEEAISVDNLCQMYLGWGAYL